jgi:hypothetical protein
VKNCVCIRDTGRPNEVPVSQWVKKGEEYTIVKIVNCQSQGIQGVELEEVKVDAALYKYFAANRFAPIAPVEVIEEELELAI